MTNDLTNLCEYLIKIHNFYVQSIRSKEEVLQITNLFDEIIEKWNQFVPLAVNYLLHILNYYDKKINEYLIKLENFDAKQISKEYEIEEVKDLMSKYIYITHLIYVELEYINTGTAYVNCGYNESAIKNFDQITNDNKTLINRKIDVVKVYKLDDSKINYGKMKELIVKDEDRNYSCLSVSGLLYLYYQFQNLMKHSGSKYKQLIDPRKHTEIYINPIYEILNDKVTRELKHKKGFICDKNKAFSLTLINDQGKFKFTRNHNKVSLFLCLFIV
jgi:hypothetical protein